MLCAGWGLPLPFPVWAIPTCFDNVVVWRIQPQATSFAVLDTNGGGCREADKDVSEAATDNLIPDSHVEFVSCKSKLQFKLW